MEGDLVWCLKENVDARAIAKQKESLLIVWLNVPIDCKTYQLSQDS